MIKLHPRFLEHGGTKAFAVLPYEEFLQIQDELQDFEDLKLLRAAKDLEGDAGVVPLEEAWEEMRGR